MVEQKVFPIQKTDSLPMQNIKFKMLYVNQKITVQLQEIIM
jgi:hypothetical protein